MLSSDEQATGTMMLSSTDFRKIEISRQELYDQVWITPVNKLADQFGISGSYLARVCDALNVPRPPVGYWQKKAVGKAKPRPDLPPAQPGDQITWSKEKPLSVPMKTGRPHASGTAPSAKKTTQPQRHPLLVGVEGHFRKTRPLSEEEFLRPYKFLLPDIVTSEGCLSRALNLTNDIYNAFEKHGHRVTFALPDAKMHRARIDDQEASQKDRKYGRYGMGYIWSPRRPTVTYIDSVPFGLALIEMTERVTLRWVGDRYLREGSKEVRSAKPRQLVHSWTTEQDVPSGRFRLTVYSPLREVEWTRSWQETRASPLHAMMPDILQVLESSAKEVQALMIAAEEVEARRKREWEEQQERRRREDDRRLIEQAHTESRKQLSDIMDKWASALAVQHFFDEVEKRAALATEERRSQLMHRLALAKAMLGPLDPLSYLEEWLAPDERYTSRYGVNKQNCDLPEGF